VLLLTTNKFSAAPTPTRGVRSLNVCALVDLALVSEANVTKSVKYEGQFLVSEEGYWLLIGNFCLVNNIL
jgi:hypothetical protein